MWFFDIIPLIIYACLRGGNDPKKRCMRCGLKTFAPFDFCPSCGQQNLYDSNSPLSFEFVRKRKLFTILTIVTFAICIISLIVLVFFMFSLIPHVAHATYNYSNNIMIASSL